MEERECRTAALIGQEALCRLHASHVLLLGLGGVGGYTFEALCRAGVGKITVVDCDAFSESNLNRQLLATEENVGKTKTDEAAMHASKIAPHTVIVGKCLAVTEENAAALLEETNPDYIVDAIDDVPAKIAVIKEAKRAQIPLVSCMGTGNKLHPELFQITDISKTNTCPLCRAVRTRLHKAGVESQDVLWSPEKPITPAWGEGEHVPASISYVPAVAGLLLGGFVIRKLIGIE